MEPCPRNPWTPFTKEDPTNMGLLWKEFKWSMSHPKQEFLRFRHGLKGTNPDLSKEWRFFGICILIAGGLQFAAGLLAVIGSFFI